MKDLLDKLSSYNIFNYLLPGVVFATLVDALTSLQVLQKDPIVGVFVYYFLGSIVSRIGSLFVEPFLHRTGAIVYAPYEDFVRAAKTDPKLEVLSEANNTYRTLCSLMLCVGVVVIYDRASSHWPVLYSAAPWILLVGLFGLYLLSYRKQTAYITQRIEANKSHG